MPNLGFKHLHEVDHSRVLNVWTIKDLVLVYANTQDIEPAKTPIMLMIVSDSQNRRPTPHLPC